eukprot:463696-Pelagomonas_calceolata.AAC.3
MGMHLPLSGLRQRSCFHKRSMIWTAALTCGAWPPPLQLCQSLTFGSCLCPAMAAQGGVGPPKKSSSVAHDCKLGSEQSTLENCCICQTQS